MKRIALTKLEKQWILYDIGNSAFILLVSTILPIFFNYLTEQAGLSEAEYMAYWGYGASGATLTVAFLGPVLGTLADVRGYKKKLFAASLVLGAGMCALLGFATHYLVFLALYVIAKIGYSASLIFYDAMLTDVTTEERMDAVSSQGYAWGYIGSCLPFLVCLGLALGYDKLGLDFGTAMILAFLVIALWWVLLSLPLLKNYRQTYFVEKERRAISHSFQRLGATFKNVRQHKKIFLFLLAFFFYIDGVYTIIDMATSYGMALGLDSTGLLLALLLTQIVAFPFALLFGRLAGRGKPERLILFCIVAYFGITVFAVFLATQTQFYILAVLVGMFQGGIQALSRSYFAKIIPNESAGEYFGLFDICGKGAAFMGTALVSVVSQATGNVQFGVAMIALLFIVGEGIFRKVSSMEEDG